MFVSLRKLNLGDVDDEKLKRVQLDKIYIILINADKTRTWIKQKKPDEV